MRKTLSAMSKCVAYSPRSNSEIRYFGDIKRPRILANVTIQKKRLRIILIHPVVPVIRNGLRDQELLTVAREAKESKDATLVFGDMNITPWCFHFERMLKEGNLNDSERGFGFQPTWCAWIAPPAFPIDHCLHSSQLVATDRKTLENVNSDHLPLLVDLAFVK